MRDMTASLVSIVLLAGWLGTAILLAAVVAPAAFAVLPSRALAGAVVGRVLPTIFWSGLGIGVLVAVLSWQTPGRAWHRWTALALASSCAAAQLVVAPRIRAVRLAAGGEMDSLASSDARAQLFRRLHGLSVGWMGLAVVAALLTLVLLFRVSTDRAIIN